MTAASAGGPQAGTNGEPLEGNPQGQESGVEEAAAPEAQATDLQKARREAQQVRRQLREAQAELEAMRQAAQTESERAIAAARQEGYTEAEKTWRAKWRNATVESAALRQLTGHVVSPKLVLPHLDLGSVEVDDEGTVDDKALADRITAVLTEFPFLASGSAPIPYADQGPKKQARPGVDAEGKHDANSLLRSAFGRS